MINFKSFIMKIVTLTVFVLCLFTTGVCAEGDEIQLYNRDQKVQLSKPLIFENEEYFISDDDLDKINIKYIFEETDYELMFILQSCDTYGTENILTIKVEPGDNGSLDDSLENFSSLSSCKFTNTMESKKYTLCDLPWMEVVATDIGDFCSVIIREDSYYISLKAISIAISYEYSVNDDEIRLWITDKNHHMVNGEISLPEGEVAPDGGLNINILIYHGDDLLDIRTLKKVTIPEGTNKTYYFIETDMIQSHNWIMFEFDGNYETFDEFIYSADGSELNVFASYVEKVPFEVYVYIPGDWIANEDIFTTIFFERSAVYKSAEAIIKKGERSGKVILNIDKNFVGNVVFTDILGDNRIFEHGYYGYGSLRQFKENARTVLATNSEIEVPLMRCYEISGQVIPSDINNGYKVQVYGVSNSFGREELYLTENVREDFTFSVKIPIDVREYTLSVAYKPGVYCGYVSDGVSSYSGEYYIFENTCNYADIKLKYQPYLPNLPIKIVKADGEKGRVEIKNISDELVTDFNLYCAHYRNGKLLNLSSTPIERLMVYSDEKAYFFDYPEDFYKTDEVKFFAWDNNLKPLSVPVAEKVNKIYKPDYMDLIDVNPQSKYYDAIEDMYLSGIMSGTSEDQFLPTRYVMRCEAATMFCRLMGYWCSSYKFSCEDIPESHWESSYVGICIAENVFELVDNKFRTYDNITIAEVYEAIANLLESKNIEVNSADILINIAGELGRDITKEEFAQMLYNYKMIAE